MIMLISQKMLGTQRPITYHTCILISPMIYEEIFSSMLMQLQDFTLYFLSAQVFHIIAEYDFIKYALV